MVAFLESQIGLLEKERLAATPTSPDAERASLVADLIAFSLTALQRMETHLGAGGLSEQDRDLVPLFQRWLTSARNLKESARALQSAGWTVSGYDDLLRAMNRCKPIAESFDHFVELNTRLAKNPISG